MYTLKDILKIEVAPALGCTEPAAVALCAASAMSLLPTKQIDSIELWVDSNVYKNGMAVSIPGASGECGIDTAAALGAVAGDPRLQMEVLDPINQHAIDQAKSLIREQKITIHVVEESPGIYIRCRIISGSNKAEALIEHIHNNITRLTLNDTELTSSQRDQSKKNSNQLEALELWLKQRSLQEIVALIQEIDTDDLEFLEAGLKANLNLAKHGLTYGSGLGVGKTLERLAIEGLLVKDMVLQARILTSAASDARMSGVKLAAMSSGGSGNHGLTAILPIYAMKDFITLHDSKQILFAIALSHVITAYIKAFTGRLSAVCGCSIAAGAGATAGITYLMGGTIDHIAGAITNLISDLAGVICDGAKNSCALKLATAAGTAVQSALFSLHGLTVKDSDGIIASTAEQTMKNVGRLSVDGMYSADRTILQIMIEKQFSKKK